jgi:hypothetical protein
MVSDVREELAHLMRSAVWGPKCEGLADCILERFDVTPKPVISNETLGQFMQELNLGIDGWQYPKYRECIGRRLRNRLEDAGFEIVKVAE